MSVFGFRTPSEFVIAGELYWERKTARRVEEITCVAKMSWRMSNCAVFSLLLLMSSVHTSASTTLEQQISQIFVGRSFTIRNFYRGGHLHYGSDGQLFEKGEPGFWSRDGMVQFSSVDLSRSNVLVMKGLRYCVQFQPDEGEFINVRTGDKVEIDVDLRSDQLTFDALIPLLQKVLLTSRDSLADLVPPYWRNCLSRKAVRQDKHSPWECEVMDRESVPEFAGRQLSWDMPRPDNSLHNGTRHYLLRHRIAYLSEPGVQSPTVLEAAADPFFNWLQNRTNVGVMTLGLAFTVGVDGRAHDIFIVTPVGMGVDDEAA